MSPVQLCDSTMMESEDPVAHPSSQQSRELGKCYARYLKGRQREKTHIIRVSETLQLAEISPRVHSKSVNHTGHELWEPLGQGKVLCLNIH